MLARGAARAGPPAHPAAGVIIEDDYDGPAARLVLAIADGTLRDVDAIARSLAPMVVVPT